MSFSIRLTSEEEQLAKSYAKLHAISVGEAFRKALFDRIEDEFDVAIADEAYQEYVDSNYESIPATEFWKELDDEI